MILAGLFQDTSNVDCCQENVEMFILYLSAIDNIVLPIREKTSKNIDTIEYGLVDVTFEKITFRTILLTIITTNLEKLRSRFNELKRLVREENIEYFYILVKDTEILNDSFTKWINIRDINTNCSERIYNTEKGKFDYTSILFFIGNEKENNFEYIKRRYMNYLWTVSGHGNGFFTLFNSRLTDKIRELGSYYDLNNFVERLHNSGPVTQITPIIIDENIIDKTNTVVLEEWDSAHSDLTDQQ